MAFLAVTAICLCFASASTAAPSGEPTVDAYWATDVTANSVELHAQIDPHDGDTTYYFEYGQTVPYEARAPIPDGAIPAASTPQEVTQSISGLNGTVYHFRVVASNELGTTTTGDQTFSFYPPNCPNGHLRQLTGSASLPDCRAYELVSPENAGNAFLQPNGPFSPVATNPPRFGFSGVYGVVPGVGPAQAEMEDLYVATRTSGGWTTKYVGLPSNRSSQTGGIPLEGTGNPAGVFADQSLGLFLDWNPGAPNLADAPFSEKFGEFAPYLWDSAGNPAGRLPSNAGEMPEAALAKWSEGGYYGDGRPSGDLSRYYFSSANYAFTPEGLTSGSGSVYQDNLETGEVRLISKLPGGEHIPEEPGDETDDDFLRIPAVSTDGTHAVIEAPRSGVCGFADCSAPPFICPCPPSLPSHLYMHVDGDQLHDVTGSHPADFRGMTPDGSKLYFTSPDQVTADDADSSTDLFMWSEGPTPTITRLSTGTGSGNADGCSPSWTTNCGVQVVQGKCKCIPNFTEMTARSDNSIAAETGEIYFLSPEQLDGPDGVPGGKNLYVYRNGAPQFVTAIEPGANVNRIQISPDGSNVAFITASPITAYDNSSQSGICTPESPVFGTPATGPRCREMYTYHPATGGILCVSCQPDGSPPVSDVEGSLNGLFMTDDGRTFFSTEDALVDQDTNGLIDIYEFVENRPQLISSGTAPIDRVKREKVGLIGVSANGFDAYFSTLDTLVGQDRNGPYFKFYDARTNGGFPFTPPAPGCAAADECHGASSAPPNAIATGTTEPLGQGGNVAHTKKKKAHKKKRKGKKSHGKRSHRDGRGR